MPTRITIRDLPPLPEGSKAVATAYASQRPKIPGGDIERFLRHWGGLHLRETRTPYGVVYGRDIGIAKALLRGPTIDELLEVVTWFWEHRNEGEGSDLLYFKAHYDRIACEKAEYERMLRK